MAKLSEEERLASEWASIADTGSTRVMDQLEIDTLIGFEPEEQPSKEVRQGMKRPDSHLERIGAALLLVVLEHRTDKEPTLKLVADVYHALGWTANVERGSYRDKDSEPPMDEILASIRRLITE